MMAAKEPVTERVPEKANAFSRAEYLERRNRFVPKAPKIIFVLESPPVSGLYFYRTDGVVSEPLFRAMMKDVLEISPATKEQGLAEFAARGYLLVDATYRPVNSMSNDERDAVILEDLPRLMRDVRECAKPNTGLVLVKMNVCDLLEERLANAGFNLLNRGVRIPFPSNGQQHKFRIAVHQVLGIDTGKRSG
jgi:hypothetical protein